MATSSLTYKSINTRGFTDMGTARMLQLLDGIDNVSPGLNFSAGNLFGLSDLDAESAELIPRAASALYGPSAFNGVLMLRSKDAFKYQGLSVQSKVGVNHVGDNYTGAAPIWDFAVRYAKAFNNRLAFKTNVSFLKGLDWASTNYNDINPAKNNILNDPGRNALNLYGDEHPRFIDSVGSISRTGYADHTLAEYNVKSFKANAGLTYRFDDRLETSYRFNYGLGTANYTGQSRFTINNYMQQQHIAEVKGSRSLENSGDTYNSVILAERINQTWVRDLQ